MSTPAAQHQVVTFQVGDDHFAADIAAVERILRYERPIAVPHLPDWMEGVIEYQARVVPVIDLGRRFGFDDARDRGAGEGRTVIFAIGGEWVGAVVDAVLDVATLPAAQVTPPPSLFRGLSAEYVRGLVRREGRLLIFLEVEQLLSATERLQLERDFSAEGAARV